MFEHKVQPFVCVTLDQTEASNPGVCGVKQGRAKPGGGQ